MSRKTVNYPEGLKIIRKKSPEVLPPASAVRINRCKNKNTM